MGSIDNSTMNSTSDPHNWLLQLSLWPLRIVCPLLIILSPIANGICICIFQSRLYERSSSKWYFIGIAIFDTIYVLVTAPLMFLLSFKIYILNWNIVLCKSLFFLNYLSCQISAGLLACLSIDRLIATSFLLLYRHHCTTNISKYVCLVVVLVFSIVNSHYLVGYTIDSDGRCTNKHYEWYEKNYARLNVVYLLSYSIIPFTIISICNVFIVVSVCETKSTMSKKYLSKKPALTTNIPNEHTVLNAASNGRLRAVDRPEHVEQSAGETRHQAFATRSISQLMNKITDETSEQVDGRR